MGVNKDLFVSTTAPKKGAPTSIIPTIQPARLRYGSGLGDFQEKLGNNINTERDDLRGMRADAQGELDKAANAVFGGVASGALTAVEDLSYIGDIHNNVQRLRGLENVDSNWLADLMKEGKAGIDKAMPIYKQNPDEVWDWGDSSSYWGALKGVLDSAVGFAIPGAAAVKGVGVLQKAARLNKYVSFLTKSKAVQQGVNTVGAGYISNFGESKMMGVELYENAVDEGKKAYYQQVFDEVKGRNINADPTQIAEIANAEFEQRLPAKLKEIEHNAGDQADKFMLKNKAFMVTDMIGLHGLYKGQGLTRGLLKDPSMKSTIKNMGKLSSDNLLIQGGKESVEEIGQNILQMEGQYQASKASGFDSDDPKELYKRVLKYGTSEQALLEGAMGFFGGGPQRVMTKTATGGYTKKGKAEEQKRFKEQQWMMDKEAKYTDATGEFNTAWYMKNKFNEFEELKTLKKKVIDSGSQEDMDELMKKQSFLKLVDTHFQRGTTEQLERTLKDIRKMSKEEATEAGFDELHKVIADDMLIELNRMEKAYSKYTRYENQDDVFINREDRNNAKFQLDYLDEQLGDAEQRLEDGDPTAQEQIEYYGNMGRETTDHIRNLDKTYKQITSYEAQSAIRKQKREIKKVAKEIGKKQKQAKAKKEATAKKAEKAAKVKAKKEAREEAAKAKTKPKKSKDKNVPGTPKQTSNPESPKSEGVNSTPDTPSTESGAGGALGKFGTKGSPKETKDEAPADIPEVTEEEKIEEKEVQNEDNRKEQRDEKGEKDFGATVESAGNVESDLLTAEDVLLGRTPTTENDDEESDNPPKYANRIGFLTREYTTGEDGVTEDDNEIITSTHADLAHILGIKNLLPGTKIKLVLADDDEIPTYLGEVDGKKQKSTWGEYKAQLKAKVSEDEYQRHFNESVPIKIVTEDGKTATKKLVIR